MFPDPAIAQGWEEITPDGLYPIHFSSSFEFQDGAFEVLVWNSAGEATRGYRLSPLMIWDSIPAYYSYWCGPPNERETYHLVSVGRSYTDPGRAFSIFVRGGCITECFTHVYSDTTGEISTQNQVAFFDDFLCSGFLSKIAVSPIDQQHVFVAFFDSLYSSSDGAQTFSATSSPVPNMFDPFLHYLALSPLDSNLIFVAGFEQLRNTYSLYRSMDMGLTWDGVLDEEVSQLEFHPTDPSVVYATTVNGVFKSTDAGETWTNVFSGAFGAIEIRSDSPDVVYAGGNGGKLYRTTDGGSNWDLYNDTFSTLSIIGIYQMPSNDTMIVTATDGVFKVFASFVLDVTDTQNSPDHFRLDQNYPNPFNPKTEIRFRTSEVRWVTLTIYDLLGRKVVTLINERLSPGTYTRQWDATGQPSGVYFYRLQAGSYAETRKLVLLR